MKLDATMKDDKVSLSPLSQTVLEHLAEVREQEEQARQGHLPCGCEFSEKFNGGDPRWFRTESCARHCDISIEVAPKVFDHETMTALMEALLRAR